MLFKLSSYLKGYLHGRAYRVRQVEVVDKPQSKDIGSDDGFVKIPEEDVGEFVGRCCFRSSISW